MKMSPTLSQDDEKENQQDKPDIITEGGADEIAEFLDVLSAPVVSKKNEDNIQKANNADGSTKNVTERKKANNQSLPKSAKALMLRWYEDHKKWPYPKAGDLAQMALDTGLKVTQVKKWFNNRRQRKFIKPDRRVKGKKPQYNDVEKIAKREMECSKSLPNP